MYYRRFKIWPHSLNARFVDITIKPVSYRAATTQHSILLCGRKNIDHIDHACEPNTDPFLTGYVPKCRQKMSLSYARRADQDRTAKRLASITSRAEPSLLAIRGRLFFDLWFEVGRLGVGKVFPPVRFE